MNYKIFLLRLAIITIVLYGLLYLLFLKIIVTPGMPLEIMLSILFVITSGAYIILVKSKEKNPRVFTYSYMAISMGRLLMCGAFVFLYALSHRDVAKPFAITFFLLYMLYAAIEVKAIN